VSEHYKSIAKLSDPTESTRNSDPWNSASASPDARSICNEKTAAVQAIGTQIRLLPEEVETRTLETVDLYLYHDPLDEALTVLVRAICPADEDCIIAMEEYGEPRMGVQTRPGRSLDPWTDSTCCRIKSQISDLPTGR
jgi:hypothetical protein